MTFSEKIEEWIKEAETRPGSALMILKLIGGRLRDLSERNEELAAENIALQDGSRVKEYQERITHLEFQLELLKRRFGNPQAVASVVETPAIPVSLLIYNIQGRVLRLQLTDLEPGGPAMLGQLHGSLVLSGEPGRLLGVAGDEEILLLFSSGRVETYRVANIPLSETGGDLNLEQAFVPDPPHAGELLVSLMPLSRLPVADFFLQASRRGSVKKTLETIFDKVLSTHYLGRGAVQKNDQAFLVTLGDKKSRFMLVTHEGHLLCLDPEALSFSAEERIRMELTDRIMAAFVVAEGDELVVCLTQNGKLIQRAANSFEIAKSALSRGQALIPASRLELGTRFIGAVACQGADWLVTLEKDGSLRAHPVKEACGSGSLPTGSEFLALGLFLSATSRGARA